MKTPTPATMNHCPDCLKAARDQEGCSHVVCPRRKPWGSLMPAMAGLDAIGIAGSRSNFGFKVRAKRGAE